MNKNKDEKLLYSYNGYINIDEYKKMLINFKTEIYWKLVLRFTFWNLIIGAIVTILFRSYFITCIVFIIIQLLIMFYIKVRFIHIHEKDYLLKHKDHKDEEYILEFYSEYLIKKYDGSSIKISYQTIDKVVETDKNIYLKISDLNIILIIIKEKCEDGVCDLIRNNINKLVKEKNDKKFEDSNIITKKLLVLFILTILTIFISNSIHDLINYFVNDKISYLINTWIYLLFIPIPVLSLLVGYKYREKGRISINNIVAGYLVLFILLIKFLPIISYNDLFDDYKNIYYYEKILNVELPSDGILQLVDDENDTLSGKDYKFIRVFYGKNVDINKEINKSNTWLNVEDVNLDLKNIISKYVTLDDISYLSIYNRTTNEYNNIPQIFEQNEYIVMGYSKEMNIVDIHHFKLD